MNNLKPFNNRNDWPDDLDEAAYHGLAGEIVRAIEPHSETDPVAILAQLLVAFGNAVGRSPHFTVEADRHYPNLFCVLVGDSARSRKGTAWGIVRYLFEKADPEWEKDRIPTGLSTGEGLIAKAHNFLNKESATDTPEKTSKDLFKPDGDDKRFLVFESEFARLFHLFTRNGNTLSTLIRDIWDRGDLQNLTKNDPIHVTDAHISIIGHITQEELLRVLPQAQIYNGFANRFMWFMVRRSKRLPHGGQINEAKMDELGNKLAISLMFARKEGRMQRDPHADRVWPDYYDLLSREETGLVDVLLSRSEAICMRLASIYALLDCTNYISQEHLAAAYALWKYSANSVRHIFDDKTGDSIADKISKALCDSPEGLTRSEINVALGKHQSREVIEAAVRQLETIKSAYCVKTQTGGRPEERWFVTGTGPEAQQNSQS